MKKIISFVFSLFKVKSGGLETKKVKNIWYVLNYNNCYFVTTQIDCNNKRNCNAILLIFIQLYRW